MGDGRCIQKRTKLVSIFSEMSLKRIFYLCMSKNCSTFAATSKKDQVGALFQVGRCVQKRTKLGGSCWVVINILFLGMNTKCKNIYF